MLDSTVESVNSALKRARAGLQRRLPPAAEREPAPAAGSPAEEAIVAEVRQRLRVRRSRRARGPADRRRLHVDAADAARVRGPRGRGRASAPASSARAGGSTSCRRAPTVSRRSAPTCAAPDGIRHGTGLVVLDARAATGSARMTRFEDSVLPVVRAAAIAPELIVPPLPGRAVADDREHGLAVALHERRPDPLDVSQLGERARPQRGDGLQRAVVGDRVGRLAVAGAHPPLAQRLEQPGVGRVSGAASRARERLP